MKMSHNKKRNTALIYEVLLCELTKAAVKHHSQKKAKIVRLLREFFSAGKILKKDLEIYKSIMSSGGSSHEFVERVIFESRRQFYTLDRKEIFDTQTTLIREMNKSLPADVWQNFIPSFRKLATINQVLHAEQSPKKQVMLESKLVKQLLESDNELKPKFPKINNLTIKTFVTKFNDEYSETLNESQKEFLKKYIFSYMDDGLEFKTFLYQEIDRLKSVLSEGSSHQDTDVQKKIEKVLERISNYNNRKLDKELVLEIFQIQALAQEIL
tara:strand:- start:1212 stop:2018 length:807 start_codon:yes stop_codon:yes gene_type:complete